MFEFRQRLISSLSPIVNTTDRLMTIWNKSARNGSKVCYHMTLSCEVFCLLKTNTLWRHVAQSWSMLSNSSIFQATQYCWENATDMTSRTYCIFWHIIRVHLTTSKTCGKVPLNTPFVAHIASEGLLKPWVCSCAGFGTWKNWALMPWHQKTLSARESSFYKTKPVLLFN